MKFLYSAIFIIGTILSQITALPIIDNFGPAIVVSKPKQSNIIYEPFNETDAIVPPAPPPAPPGPIFDDLMPANFAMQDRTILYIPREIKQFIIDEE